MADDVEMANRRLDASDNEALIGMARVGAEAFGYTADLRIDRQLAQLLRLRVSQLNNCTYCLTCTTRRRGRRASPRPAGATSSFRCSATARRHGPVGCRPDRVR